MATTYEYYYFSRANFFAETDTLLPSPDEWKKECLCKMPYNPDRVYVQCENCQKWFHDSCIGTVDLDKTYVCQQCEKVSSDRKKIIK
jgi:hypothetical protein